jgi:hypothetical protein
MTDFPTGASSIVVEDAVTGEYNIYYPTVDDLPLVCDDIYNNCYVWPSAGITVPVNALTGEPTVYVSVDPTAFGFTQVIIPFVSIDNAGFESLNEGQAILNLYPVPDLTPVIDLPGNTFTANQTRNVVLYAVEVNDIATVPGTAIFGLTLPSGFRIENYNGSLTQMTPAGGFLTDVQNEEFEVVLQTPTQMFFRAKAGISISAFGFKAIGVQITRTTALNQSVSNMTLGIFPDATGIEYDSYNLNNIFTQILNAQ